MKKIQVPIIISTKGFVILNAHQKNYVTIMPENVRIIPNMPFYHMIWTDTIESSGIMKTLEPNTSQVKSFLKEEYGNIKKVSPILITSSDLFAVDSQLLGEYFLTMGVKETSILKQSELFTTLVSDYVAITVSERILSIEKYQNGKSSGIEYLDAHTCTIEELENCINSYKRSINSRQVYISDPSASLICFDNLGKIFHTKELFELAKEKLKK